MSDGAKYRLYIDEVGNSDLGASRDPNHRYLSLTGVILELDYVQATVFPRLEAIKTAFFRHHPDDPVVLHRKELVNRRRPFEALRDPKVEAEFNRALMETLEQLDYVVITAVIDKLEHLNRYPVWRFDPYHYCLTVLVERYALWLERQSAKGDVMAESRGGREDRRLKASFERVFEHGSTYLDAGVAQSVLTSRQLKMKSKANNIAGLQLADLIAHPSFKCALARRNNEPLARNFGGQIATVLEATKYDRSPAGRIDGWGRKWLP